MALYLMILKMSISVDVLRFNVRHRENMSKLNRDRDVRALAPIIGRKAAKEALDRYSFSDLVLLDRDSLLNLAYIGPRKADAIQVLPELIELLSESRVEDHSVSCSRDVYDLYRHRLGRSPKEQFTVLTLNSRNAILSEELCALGTLNTVHVTPAEVLRQAVLRSAASIICLHNHPSGDPSPSAEDRILTDRISRAASLMGIRLLDHIIITIRSYYSFSDAGGLG
jgi:DNA repair protein RadC